MRKWMVGIAGLVCAGLLLEAAGPEKIDLGILHRIKSAGEWTIKKMNEWGLANAKMEAWGPFGRGWSCTHFSAELKEPEFMPLIGFAQPWSSGTNGPVSGEAVLAVMNGPDDLDKFKGKLKG